MKKFRLFLLFAFFAVVCGAAVILTSCGVGSLSSNEVTALETALGSVV